MVVNHRRASTDDTRPACFAIRGQIESRARSGGVYVERLRATLTQASANRISCGAALSGTTRAENRTDGKLSTCGIGQ